MSLCRRTWCSTAESRTSTSSESIAEEDTDPMGSAHLQRCLLACMKISPASGHIPNFKSSHLHDAQIMMERGATAVYIKQSLICVRSTSLEAYFKQPILQVCSFLRMFACVHTVPWLQTLTYVCTKSKHQITSLTCVGQELMNAAKQHVGASNSASQHVTAPSKVPRPPLPYQEDGCFVICSPLYTWPHSERLQRVLPGFLIQLQWPNQFRLCRSVQLGAPQPPVLGVLVS